METAHWLSTAEILAGLAPQGRIYLGSQTCERTFADPAAYLACIQHLLQSGRAVSLVTPPLTEGGVGNLERLLEAAAGRGERFEVVCSDWGMVEALKGFPQLTPVIGPLLSRQCADPRFGRVEDAAYHEQFEKDVTHLDGTAARLRYRPPSPALMDHLRAPAVQHPALLAVLAQEGISRFEVNNLLQGVELAPPAPWRVSLHVPGVTVAVRRCRQEDPTRCAGCEQVVERGGEDAFGVPLFLTPSEVFYLNPNCQWVEREPSIDRLVLRRPG